MLRSKGFTNAYQDSDPVSWVLTGMSLFFAGFLWLTFALLLLRLGHFSRNASVVFPLFGIVFFLSFCSFGAHFFHSALSEWKCYPFWLDETDQKGSSFLLSLPNLLVSVLLLGWNMSWTTAGTVLSLFLLELTVRRYAPSVGEAAGHFLRAHAPQNSSPPSPDRHDAPAEPYAETDVVTPSARTFPEQAAPFAVDEVIKLSPGEDLYREDEEEIEEEAEVPPPEDLLVTQNRCLNPDGSQRVEGWFRVPFSRGETVSVCHLAFCPPFKSRPHLQLIQLEGDEVQITPTMTEPFGARIEIKRALPKYIAPFAGEEQDGEPVDRSVRICFFADETAPHSEQG